MRPGLPLVLLLLARPAAAETHRLKPIVGHPTFAVRPPILTVQPGDVLESESLWGEWYEKPGGKWPEGDEAFGGLWPGPFGGNLDASDVTEGTTVYLPVFHPGALFYFGDGHALQGDAEVCGSGLETSMEVAFRFGLLKKKRIDWPRLEDAEHLMVAGSARPLSDALRIAFVELIRWLVAEHGFHTADAYQLVSQVAVVRVANMVDPAYTVVAKFPKRYLPPAAATPRSPFEPNGSR